MMEPDTQYTRDEIAIVGMAGRFPDADDVQKFWENLRNGVESVRELSHDEMVASGVEPDELEHPSYVSAGVPLEDADGFDAAFFGINPTEAELMDPQHRVFLECAWAALEDSGYDPGRYPGPIGVFGGVARNTYFIHQFQAYKDLIDSGGLYEAMLGFEKDFVATRVAYKLNLKGPAFDVQTACSTSGVAVHLACQSLLNGECDMALAGGARIRVPLRAGYVYVEGGVPSPDGHCRAFDADAAGCVFGSGAAILALKRLDDAIRDGDHIRAVIKGTAVNNDGSAKIGFTAPSIQGQAAVIEEALAMAGVSADTIGYVETHGTGTTLGDPIEISALTRAFRKTTDRKGYCPVGSVKTNIGHLDAGASVAGIVKTVLALEHAEIPPSLNFKQPNPQIDFANSPFFVNAELRDWEANGTPRRAGVSSFGLGGTNVHVVLEEAPRRVDGGPSRSQQLLLLSAKSAPALQNAMTALGSRLEDRPDLNLADVAYTLQVGRARFGHRAMLVCADGEDAVGALESHDPRRIAMQQDSTTGRSMVFMFPGGGAQYLNMGRDLYRNEPVFREQVEECLRLLDGKLPVDLRALLYGDHEDADQAARDLERPLLALPALLMTEYALARLWMSWGIRPAAMIGHSLGEYAAACIAGVMSLADALSLAVLRGRLFEQIPSGGMLSVPLAEPDVRRLMVDGLSIAAINTPGSCVLSGPTEDIRRMTEVLDREGIEYTPLHISVAAHSPMVEPILDEFRTFLRSLRFEPPRVPFVTNVSGTWITAEEATDPEHWVRHLRQTVRFSDGIGVLLADPSLGFLEVGPGQTLSVFTRQHPGKTERHVVASSLRHPKERTGDVEFLLNSLGRLWLSGADVEWSGFYGREVRRRVSLPTYPFERRRFWLERKPGGRPAVQPAAVAAQEAQAPARDHERSPSYGADELPQPANEIGAAGGAGPKERVLAILTDTLQDLSGADMAGVDPHATFLELGFDSLFLTRANIEFQKRFGLRITFRQLFDEAPSLDALAAFIASNLPPDFFPAEPAPTTAPSPAAAGGGSVAATVAEVEALGARLARRLEAGTGDTAPSGAIERVIAEQLRIMQEQLRILEGADGTGREIVAGGASPADRAGPVAAPTSQIDRGTERVHGPWKPIAAGGGSLSDHQREHLDALIERYTRRTRGSKMLTAGQRGRLADPRAITGFQRSWKEMIYQIAMTGSSGARMVDVDGNEYVDLTMGFGINVFGHSPAFVQDAIRRQLDRGVELGALTSLASDAAELLCELTGMERVTFVNTGSEAVAAAVRAARTVTARDRIAVFDRDYHGIADEFLVGGVQVGDRLKPIPIAPGIPQSLVQNVLVLDYEDPNCIDILRAEADQLAAVVVEPVPSRRPDFQPGRVLSAVRKVTAEHGAALIFDELLTGFRVHQRGAQGLYGVDADIVAYGKILSGGLPMAAVAGRAAYLDAFDGGSWSYGDDSFPEARVTFFGGTFVRHPLSMAASVAVLERLEEAGPELQEQLNERADRFADLLNALFARTGAPMRLANCGSMLYLTFTDDNPLSRLIFFYLREKGVHVWDRPCFLSTAHTDADLEFIVRAAEASITEMQEAHFLPATRPAAGRAVVTPQTPPAPVPAGEATRVPLTESQLEIWLATRFSDDASRAYHLSLTIELTGPLDREALDRAFGKLLERHEALRTTISEDGDYQLISATPGAELSVVDVSDLDARAAGERVRHKLSEDLEEPFDLTTGPLLRARLVRYTDEHHALILVIHHIVCDAASLHVFGRDLGVLYSRERGDTARVLPDPMQFRDYAAAEEERRDTEQGRQAEAYWLDRFAEPVADLELPTDHPRPPEKTYRAAQARLELPASLYADLKRVAASRGCTPFTAMLAAYKVLLHGLTGQRDMVVAIATTGHSLVGHDLIGHCINTLPIRTAIPADRSFAEYLTDVKAAVFDAFDHRDFTYGALLKKLKVRRDPSRTPLVSVMFNLDPQARDVSFTGLEARLAFNPKRYENFDLFLNAVLSDEVLKLELTYNTDLFDAPTAERWLAQLGVVVSAVSADPSSRVADVPLLTDEDRHRILVEWNRTDAEYPRGSCLHGLIETQARGRSEEVAAICGADALTYGELDRRSNQLAHHLRGLGVEPGATVGLCVERSLDMLVGLLGILKAGAAYLPLDPDFPGERLRFMLEDSGARTLVAHADLVDRLPAEGRSVVLLDGDRDRIAEQSDASPDLAVDPESLAYLIYTSGSTGQPKGVQVPHRAVVNFLTSMAREPGLGPDDVLLAVTTLSFDISVLELFLPLAVGGRVVLSSREDAEDGRALLAHLEASGATVMQATPATWRLLLEAGWSASPSLKVLCGGEALTRDLADGLLERAAEVWNMYGPTETTVWSTCWRVEAGAGPVSIGRPIANTRVYVLDASGRPVPVGVTGELCIGGAGVTHGYWGRAELTAERFIEDPFSGQAGARLYRTGDVARFRADGTLECLGRLDNQVKVRGFRIELGEIESALGAHAAVQEGVVDVREDRPGDVRLVAYVVWRHGEAATTSELRRHLRAKLPEYMVPQHFVELEELPKTPNRKVDRRALPAPFASPTGPSAGHTAPRNEREQLIASIWEEVLGAGTVGVHDNFFDLGGHSLLSMQVISRIERETGRRLSPRAMILHTLEQIAAETENGHGPARPDVETGTQDAMTARPVSGGIARRLVSALKKSLADG